jgi:carboxyl-terminal processing protease
MKPLLKAMFMLLAALGTMQASGDVRDTGDPRTQLLLDDLRTFTDVFQQLRSNYIEEIDDATLLRAAIHGMVSELDPYSSYIEAEEYRALDDSSRGRHGGIGAEVMIQQRRLVILAVREDGPAQQAGILPGDVITAVDDRPVRGRKLSESIAALQGEPGSEVTLRVRSGKDAARELTLTRAYAPVSSVTSEWLEPGIALLKISHFHADSGVEFREKMERLGRTGEAPMRGLIIDLRQNLGGVLQAAVEIADGFLESGLIVNTRSRYAATRLEFHAREGQWAAAVPLAVLVDMATASASEVLAGALQDQGRAVVIGNRTYGKGSVQSVLKLRNGAALRLTTALYFTPSGRSLQNEGIQPDITTDVAEDAKARALEWIREALTASP